MTPKPESETDPWAKVKRRQGTVIEHGPGVLGGGAWSAKAAVYLAKEVDAARAAEAAQHQQALERLTRQAQDMAGYREARRLAVQPPPPAGSPTTEQMNQWLSAMETGATHDQRRLAWNNLRDHFNPLKSTPVEPAGAHVETLRQMVGMAGEFRQTLLTVRECIDALTPGHRTGYDWNADPLYMTRYVGDALKAIDAGLKSLNGQAAVPTYRNVYIVTHYPDGGLRGVHASQAGAEAEIAELCREYPDYTRQDFSIVCDRIRPRVWGRVHSPGGRDPQTPAHRASDRGA